MEPTGAAPGSRAPDGQEPEPTLRDAFATVFAKAGIAQVAPGEIPTARSLLTAIGGVRGMTEAILPGLGFLVLYAVTKNLWLSVLAPVAVAVVFVILRLVSRSSLSQSITGVAGVALSAGIALFTGRAEDNFVVGIVINSISLLVLLISVAVKFPFIGIIVGVLSNEGLDWRKDSAKRRVLTLATLLWVGLFAVRLAVEVPLYLAGEVEWLAGVKLLLGIPLYAAMLWVTWLLVRTVYSQGTVAPTASE